jgi:hypothetical protein
MTYVTPVAITRRSPPSAHVEHFDSALAASPYDFSTKPASAANPACWRIPRQGGEIFDSDRARSAGACWSACAKGLAALRNGQRGDSFGDDDLEAYRIPLSGETG